MPFEAAQTRPGTLLEAAYGRLERLFRNRSCPKTPPKLSTASELPRPTERGWPICPRKPPRRLFEIACSSPGRSLKQPGKPRAASKGYSVPDFCARMPWVTQKSPGISRSFWMPSIRSERPREAAQHRLKWLVCVCLCDLKVWPCLSLYIGPSWPQIRRSRARMLAKDS